MTTTTSLSLLSSLSSLGVGGGDTLGDHALGGGDGLGGGEGWAAQLVASQVEQMLVGMVSLIV